MLVVCRDRKKALNVQALSDQPSNGFRTRRLMGFTGAPAINSLLEI